MRRGLKEIGWTLSFLLLAGLYPAGAEAQSLKPYVEGDQLHLRSSNLRLLSSKAKEQLRNGATVTYAFRVTWMAAKGGEARASYSYHCEFSFALWEKTYKVSRREPGFRSVSGLSEETAEQLCLESLVIPVSILPATAGFWISLVYQMDERPSASSADYSRSIPGVLVEIFSRRKSDSTPTSAVDSGPFRLTDLRKAR
jgi:hypothetical protein